jgi:antitoxin VapB
MALHINDPQTDKLARQLADQTGESLTTAVNKALKERLDRVGTDREAEIQKKMKEIERIAAGAKGLRKLKKSSRELIDELYDENGLPR